MHLRQRHERCTFVQNLKAERACMRPANRRRHAQPCPRPTRVLPDLHHAVAAAGGKVAGVVELAVKNLAHVALECVLGDGRNRRAGGRRARKRRGVREIAEILQGLQRDRERERRDEMVHVERGWLVRRTNQRRLHELDADLVVLHAVEQGRLRTARQNVDPPPSSQQAMQHNSPANGLVDLVHALGLVLLVLQPALDLGNRKGARLSHRRV